MIWVVWRDGIRLRVSATRLKVIECKHFMGVSCSIVNRNRTRCLAIKIVNNYCRFCASVAIFLTCRSDDFVVVDGEIVHLLVVETVEEVLSGAFLIGFFLNGEVECE